jgi:metal-sulfur cluster biosynthetic enzyme
MRSSATSDLGSDLDQVTILERLNEVLDPELDESIVKLGFVRSIVRRGVHVHVVLALPTSWCAITFAYIMAEDIRHALLGFAGIKQATIGLLDHCAAQEIEAAVNTGKTFADAFPQEAPEGLNVLKTIFLRKGYLVRQERLLRTLREAGCAAATICALRQGDVVIKGGRLLIAQPGETTLDAGPGETLKPYLKRRSELGLSCAPDAVLITDDEDLPIPAGQLKTYYQIARTVSVALDANGSFCRVMLATRRTEMKQPTKGEGDHVPS